MCNATYSYFVAGRPLEYLAHQKIMEAEISDFTEYLLCARHSFEHFTCVTSRNAHNFLRKVVYLFSFYE